MSAPATAARLIEGPLGSTSKRALATTAGATVAQTPIALHAQVESSAFAPPIVSGAHGPEASITEIEAWQNMTALSAQRAGLIDSNVLVRVTQDGPERYASHHFASSQKFWRLNGPHFEARRSVAHAVDALMMLSRHPDVVFGGERNALAPEKGGMRGVNLRQLFSRPYQPTPMTESAEVALALVKLRGETTPRILFTSSGARERISDACNRRLGEFVRSTIDAAGGATSVEELVFVHSHPRADDRRFRALASGHDRGTHVAMQRRYFADIPAERVGDYTAWRATRGEVFLAEYGDRVDPGALAEKREIFSR